MQKTFRVKPMTFAKLYAMYVALGDWDKVIQVLPKLLEEGKYELNRSGGGKLGEDLLGSNEFESEPWTSSGYVRFTINLDKTSLDVLEKLRVDLNEQSLSYVINEIMEDVEFVNGILYVIVK